MLQCAAGAGVFELQILEFSNYRAEVSSGACCGGGTTPAPGGAAPRTCAVPCRTRFTLCLKEYQSAAAPGACSFGRAASPVLGTDSFTLAEPLYTLALPFSFRWTVSVHLLVSTYVLPFIGFESVLKMPPLLQRSFTLILQAYDDYEYPEPGE